MANLVNKTLDFSNIALKLLLFCGYFFELLAIKSKQKTKVAKTAKVSQITKVAQIAKVAKIAKKAFAAK